MTTKKAAGILVLIGTILTLIGNEIAKAI